MSAVPPLTSRLWDDLVTGRCSHKFELFAANMAVSRAVRIVASDPGQKGLMIAELHQFFVKFERTVANDLQKLA